MLGFEPGRALPTILLLWPLCICFDLRYPLHSAFPGIHSVAGGEVGMDIVDNV